MKRQLVIMPFGVPWEWTTDYHQQTAHLLSKKNVVVCLVPHHSIQFKDILLGKKKLELFKKHTNSILIYQNIHFIPFRRFHLIERLNTLLETRILLLALAWLKIKTGIKKQLVWIFEPSTVSMAKMFTTQTQTKILYDCCDYWRETGQDSAKDAYIQANENYLLKAANYVFVNSKTLETVHRDFRPDLTVVPQGFRLDSFASKKLRSQKRSTTQKPIIGFVGGINNRLNYQLLYAVVSALENCEFVLAGPIQKSNDPKLNRTIEKHLRKLRELPNVTILPAQPKHKIPELINSFDICMIPYDESLRFNTHCYPMKLFEYFYLGKPVISTNIKELVRFPEFVKMSSTAAGWNKILKELLKKPWPKNFQKRQRLLSEANSWQAKLSAINNALIAQGEKSLL